MIEISELAANHLPELLEPSLENLAKRLGIEAEGIASSTKWYFWPNGFAREVIAIFNMTRKTHIAAAGVLLILSVLLALI